MSQANEFHAEQLARDHLLKSGIVPILKQAGIVVWTLRASSGQLRLAIDNHTAPEADTKVIREEIQNVLKPVLAKINYKLEIVFRPIAGNCCYGVCQGCLNGSPEDRKTWIE